MYMASLRDRAGYGVDGGDGKMEEVLHGATVGQKNAIHLLTSPVRMV
jgi:hypothetical protein